MKPYNEETEIKLNELLEKAFDAEKGFIKASEHVDSPRLKTFFKEKAIERNEYVSELSRILKAQGMDVAEMSASLSGSIHRAWIDTKALFSLDDDESMLEEVRNGENAAIEDYEELLNNYELNQEVRVILLKQKNAIEMNRRHVEYLEHIK